MILEIWIFIEKLGCSIYKVASFELTFDDLLAEVGSTRKPVFLSTGMGNLDEVEHALEILDRNSSGPVILFHCCSAYPAPVESVNLRAIHTLETRFKRLVGFSDHSLGSEIPIIASAMGAVAIEKHITNNTGRTGPDHRFSITLEEMMKISQGIHTLHLARGTGCKVTQSVEETNKSIGRRSAFSLRDLPKNHQIEKDDFRFVRPCSGIPSNHKNKLIGQRLVRSVSAFNPITFEDIGK